MFLIEDDSLSGRYLCTSFFGFCLKHDTLKDGIGNCLKNLIDGSLTCLHDKLSLVALPSCVFESVPYTIDNQNSL